MSEGKPKKYYIHEMLKNEIEHASSEGDPMVYHEHPDKWQEGGRIKQILIHNEETAKSLADAMKDQGLKPDQEFMRLLQPGKFLKLFFGESNPNNQVREIRSVVDSEFVVYRVWNRSKSYWDYRIKWFYDFWLAYKDGYLIEFKAKEAAGAQSDDTSQA